MNDEIKNKILSGDFGKVLLNEELKNYTTMHIGGPADILVMPETEDKLTGLVKTLKGKDVPLTFIGRGSNLLIRDKGIRGVVVVLRENYSEIKVEGNIVTAQAGAALRDAAIASFKNSLTGMEAVSGIPGSVGGGVIMKAGAYGTEMKDIIKSVKTMDKDGNIKVYSNEEMDFSYRHSLAGEKGLIVLEASFELKEGDRVKIYEAFEDFDYKRSSRQPLARYSAESTFKRPEGHFASKSIDEAGLRGFTINQAQVSEKHTGFLINIENSTCENMLELIKEVQKIIMDKYSVKLEREVKLIGEE